MSDWITDVCSSDLRLAENTSRYARYSRSAGGLSLVIGGVLCLAAFVIGATVGLTPAWRYTLVAAPLLWLASKELLRAFYYQRAGAVRERLSDRQRRGPYWMVAYLAAMALMIIGRSEEPTSELQSLMRNSYAVFCLKKK